MAHPVRKRNWSAVIADFGRSGLTQVEFCRRRHISIHSFRSHLYSPRHRLPLLGASAITGTSPHSTPAQSAAPSFLPVHVRPKSSVPLAHHDISQSPATLELVFGDELLVRIPVGFDPVTLGRLLDFLESRS